jgi:hypothetical protein
VQHPFSPLLKAVYSHARVRCSRSTCPLPRASLAHVTRHFQRESHALLISFPKQYLRMCKRGRGDGHGGLVLRQKGGLPTYWLGSPSRLRPLCTTGIYTTEKTGLKGCFGAVVFPGLSCECHGRKLAYWLGRRFPTASL